MHDCCHSHFRLSVISGEKAFLYRLILSGHFIMSSCFNSPPIISLPVKLSYLFNCGPLDHCTPSEQLLQNGDVVLSCRSLTQEAERVLHKQLQMNETFPSPPQSSLPDCSPTMTHIGAHFPGYFSRAGATFATPACLQGSSQGWVHREGPHRARGGGTETLSRSRYQPSPGSSPPGFPVASAYLQSLIKWLFSSP